MVKAKKAASKKSKQEEASSEAENPVEDSVAVDGVEDIPEGMEQNTDKVAEQNGGDDAASVKKKPASKKAAAKTSETEQNGGADTDHNGGGDAATKKKPASKKAAKTPKPQVEPERKSSRTPKPVIKEGTGDETYEVAQILGFRLNRGKPQYLIRWKGYTSAEDTWESESNLNCPELLQKYKEENPSKAKKRSPSKSPTKSAKKTKKEEKDYEVEQIVGFRTKKGKKEFKIRWKGYKPSDDSWEPEKHLSCQDLISEYLEQHKDDVQNQEKTPKKKTPAKSTKGKKTKGK